jgi:hypothetical protein
VPIRFGLFRMTFDLRGSSDYDFGGSDSLAACAATVYSPFAITAMTHSEWVGETLSFPGTGGMMAISITGPAGGKQHRLRQRLS